MTYITWYNIYCHPWFDAEVVAKNISSQFIRKSNPTELKMRKDLIKLNGYKNDETMLINLICSNRVLDISEREDIHEFKSWVKTMLEYATRKEK